MLPMFVFKGVRSPKIKIEDELVPVQTYINDAKIAMRKKLASVDTTNFLGWAEDFVAYKINVHLTP